MSPSYPIACHRHGEEAIGYDVSLFSTPSHLELFVRIRITCSRCADIIRVYEGKVEDTQNEE